MKRTYIQPSLKAFEVSTSAILAGSGNPATTILIPVGTGSGPSRARMSGDSDWEDEE